jgi:heme/copper-type cytochrome/quinol oxidase subunit 2
MMLCFMPTVAMAKKALRNVVIVADTRKLDGLMLWWAQMYNDSHLYFMILTIIIIPITGCIFGVLADFVMNHIGIDLKHRRAAE